MADLDTWGVTVAQVVAVASQADVYDDSTDDDTNTSNSVFNKPNIARTITHAEVQTWIERVAAWVGNALHRRSRLSDQARTELEAAMATAVEVGAAAYLVDAAYPQRSGVNDQASYGSVLWTRYRQALDDLKTTLDDRLDSEDSATGSTLPAGGQFPRAIVTDDWVRQSTSHMAPGGRGVRAPGAEEPYDPARW